MPSEHPVHMDILCLECEYRGPAPMSVGVGPRIVTCPQCFEEWEVGPDEEKSAD